MVLIYIFSLKFVMYLGVGIFRLLETWEIWDIWEMLYGGTCCCILLIYPIYKTKYNKISSIKYLEYLAPNLK